MPRWAFWCIVAIVVGLVIAPTDTAHILSSLITGIRTFITSLGLH